MGKLFKSWFKKKKQESIITPTLETTPTNTKLYTPDETPLNFTHGSLLDDVLNGLQDHQAYPKTKNDAPDLPLSSTVRHLDSWSKIETVPEHENQQKQTIGESYGNNGSNTHQQNKVSQAYLCSLPPTPETSDALGASPPSRSLHSPSAKVMTPPSSAATPSTSTPSSSSTSLSPPRLIPTTSHYETSLATPLSPANDQVDDSEESSSSPDTVGSNDMVSNGHHPPQQKSKMTAPQQQDIQHHRLSLGKSPSIASRDSNQDKRNHRYSQATGVSMSRMKERHRQDCRRSMQSPCQQQQQQQTSDSYPHPPSTQNLSFQSTPLLAQQQQQQQQQQQKKPHPKPQQNRHMIASPSMPSIYPVEPMSSPPQSLSPLHHTIPAATNSVTSYSIPPPPPSSSNTMSMARSPSLMTDIHYQQQSTPGGNIGTMTLSPLANDFMHPSPSWRQQPLFPYQSDIILPPYSPSQLGTFQQQQQQIMQSPYRIKPTTSLPRSASVYGNVNQYHHYKHLPLHDIHHGSGVLLRPSSTSMDLNGNRKLVPTSTRLYQPQLLSISTQSPLDQSKKQQQQQQQSPEDFLETTASMPASFLPSSSSPTSKESAPSHQQEQQQNKTPSSSSSSSVTSSPCTTPTNIDQKTPTAIRDGNMDMDQQVASRRGSTRKSSKNGDSNEKLEMHSPTATLEKEDPNHSKKKHRHRRQKQRRRFSLPTTMPTTTSPSRSSSTHSKQDQPKNSIEESTAPMQNENLGKLEIGNDQCQHQHHPQTIGSPSACSATNGMHLCTGGIHPSAYNASPTTPCCPPAPSTCQPPPHHHLHHHPHQHYVNHPCSCVYPPLPPPPPSCCQPQPPSPSCCSPRSHHHHHRHHHRHHRNRHHHHSTATKQQQMRKSKSCMTKTAMEYEEDDAMTIGSAKTTKKQKQQQQQQHLSMPTSQSMISPMHTSDDDVDDDDTVNGEDTNTRPETTTNNKMKTSPSKPFLRSLLPRAPRFTSLPRTLQDQQKKTKMTTSKSSYSWIPPRA